ncbi:dTDP-4-dehydrorhamnose 3,5-epimerase [Acuticoccus sp.]|uniref:dTDP-4-dehydrorhamnose 3,5-epimerase n=1 Tax=Acuticoccus sp. TaxID=1904378 RepID=UPI003B5280DE
MDIIPLNIADVVLVRPRRYTDDRGWLEETWHGPRMAEAGLAFDFVQDNQSLSHRAGTVRGLHFQVAPHPQAKLVRALAGALLDVAVDLRQGSATYGRWVSAELSVDNGLQMVVPRGFAHGFRTLVPDTMVAYKVDGLYDRSSERGIRFDDPDLAIDWGGSAAGAVLSDKDRALPTLAEAGKFAF